MRKIYVYIIILLLIILNSSCLKNIPKVEDTNFSDLTNTQKELLIRVIATGYNRGGNKTFEELLKYANENGYIYDDNVLEFYKYFVGEINNTTKTKSLSDDPHYNPKIKNYILNIINDQFKNNSPNVFDNYDEIIPTNSSKKYPELNPNIITSFEKREFLVNRLYNKIKEYYNTSSTFKSWFEYFYPNENLTDIEIKKYSEYLVDVAYTYTNSNIELNRLHNTSSELYPSLIKLNHIPVELILAIIMQESRFFPGSFRAEIDNNNIYALSFGLTHTLIDADFLGIASTDNTIGDGNKGERNFDLISYFYLGNNRNEETYFSDWDLVTIRGSMLYALIYLDMLYQKYITEVIK
ncbi:hypothetical protein [Marinitoga sp. 38H-ov]|uniref:hypothetical protein n=1 Tax=Marinitoga sp. 38H-ov TaxID=1755814 RepID=UPI0013ECF796|nr:hypothetical protein [Marinitoga sp. 38H-ov]KAF2956682.1 hypothetical protein AS160_04690 [Marinitoga sp. 38H-ov]